MESQIDINRLIERAKKAGLTLSVNAEQTMYRFSRKGIGDGAIMRSFDEALAFIRGVVFRSMGTAIAKEQLKAILARAMESEHYALTDNPDPPSRSARVEKLAERILRGE